MKRYISSHTFSSRGMISLYIAIVVMVLGSGFLGANLGNQTVTIANTTTTSTIVTTIISSTVSSFTETFIRTTFTPSYVTVTVIGPNTLVVSGKASTRTIGTTATAIEFTSVSKPNSTFNGQISNGVYSVTIANYDGYNVYVDYTTATGGVGAGKCLAGALTVNNLQGTQAANWSC